MQPAPLAQAVTGANVLTITKTISGTGSGPFTVTITGPSGYITNTQIDGGQTKVLTGLASGIYTVTESSPGAGWTTIYTATASTGSASGGSTNAAVALQNANTATLAATPLTGMVFRDFNSDGLITTNGTISDTGVSSVVVTAYDKNGNVVGSAVTDAIGEYTINPTADGPYRVEFSNLPSGYEPSRVYAGTQNGTSVQFINTAAQAGAVNLGVLKSADYCQNNPLLCTPVAVSGDASSLTLPAMYSLRYDGTGQAAPAQQNEIGSTWGLAYKRDTKQLFASAYVQRHVGLGPLGLGGIYTVTGADTATPSAGGFVDLDAAPYNINFGTLPNNLARGLPVTVTQLSTDTQAFAAVGKQGMGGLELSADGNSLWAVNLYTATGNLASLIKLDLNNGVGGSATQYPLASMTGLPTCTGGVLRPWALKIADGKGYLGAVCSAEKSGALNDLKGFVLSFEPTNPSAITIEVTIPLTYTKGESNTARFGTNDAHWNPWLDTFNTTAFNWEGNAYTGRPTPILADIEFDSNGGMILGFADRAALQLGAQNADPTATVWIIYHLGGELLRSCQDAGGVYVLENDGVCGGVTGFSTTNNKGPGGGEFYNDNTPISFHEEAPYGGLAQLPGARDVVVGAYDPLVVNTGGIIWNSNVNGTKSRTTQLWVGENSGNGFFGKANGQGDIELLCDAAPIEIGNRVWDDLDGDGVQDPGEPGIASLTVSLQGPTNTVTVNTDADGLYYFNNLQTNTTYTLTMNVPAGYSLTPANAQALAGASVSSNHAISDTRDSDAVLVGGVATIYYTTGSAGQNNHGLDFGFTQPTSGQVDILNSAPPVVADPGGFSISKAIATTDGSNPSVSGTFDVVVNCPGVSGYPATLSLNANGTPVTAGNLVSGTVCSFSENTLTLPAAPSGYTWVNAQISPASITIVGNMTATVTAHNTLAPLPEPPTGVLTVTKTISGTGSGPFNLAISGPSGYLTTTTINGGETKLITGLVSGLYTVTETSPGAGWTTTYTATTGYSTGSSAVVTLTNATVATRFTPSGSIVGTVFSDYNSDGNLTANGTITDTGVQGVTVAIYDMTGALRETTMSDANGNYTFTVASLDGVQGPYRVEFSNLPAGYEPSRNGAQNGTSVQFVNSVAQASGVNLGILRTDSYNQSLMVATVDQIAGDPLQGGALASTGVVHSLSPTYSGTTPVASVLATAGQVGSVWGTAWQPSANRLFVSAMVKRHVGLGPQGLGGIYVITDPYGTPSVANFVDLENAPFNLNLGSLPNNVARGLPITATLPSLDVDAFGAVGKQGLGDIDLTEDGQYLWAVDLNNRALVRMNVANGATPTRLTSYSFANELSGEPSCPNGVLRPWALKFYGGRGYVGVVCTAELSLVRFVHSKLT